MDNKKYEEIKKNYLNNLADLKNDLSKYLNQVNTIAGDFGGPSVYFHNRALQEINNDFLGNTHIEMIYAVLPSWGMHKMGDTSTKIVNFDNFYAQINNNREIFNELRNKTINEIDIKVISDLLVNKLSFSIADSHLVSSSKVLHHIVPNFICPIDRQYSIRFLLQTKDKFVSVSKKGKKQYSAIGYNNNDEINYCNLYLSEMYKFIEDNKLILHEYLDKEINLYKSFNSNLTKIFDNLIMLYVKSNGVKEDAHN